MRKLSMCQKKSSIENFYAEEGDITNFSGNLFLSHTTKKVRRETLLCFKKNSSSKKFHAYEGASEFCRKFLSDRTEMKNFVSESSV